MSRLSGHLKGRRKRIVALGFGAFILCVAFGWRPLLRAVDGRGITDNAAQMAQSGAHTDPQALRAALALELDAASAPAADVVAGVVLRPRSATSPHTATWQLPGLQAMELRYVTQTREGEDEAVAAYVSSRGTLGERPVELFLPGAGVSDLAFFFLKRLFRGADAAGADVVVWVPPDHLERQRGDVAGDDLFGPDLSQNVHSQRVMVREVRTLLAALRARGVPRIGIWAGSLGASVGVLAASVDHVDHMALMIPLLDWRTLILRPPSFGPIVASLHQDGVDDALLERALLAGSPVGVQTPGLSGRGLLLYAEEDQLTPPATNLEFAERHGFIAKGYAASHASILLVPSMYEQTTGFFRDMLTSSSPTVE